MMTKQTTLSLQIGNRLFRTALIIWLLIAVLVAAGSFAFYRTDQSYSQMLDQVEILQSSVLQLNTAIVREMLNTRAYLITGQEENITKRALAYQDAERELGVLKDQLSKTPTIQTPSLAVLETLQQQYRAIGDQMINLRRSGKNTEARQLFDSQSEPLVTSLRDSSLDLQSELQDGMLVLNEAYTSYTRQWIMFVVALFLLGTALGGVFLLRLVSPPLRTLDLFETTLVNAANTGVYQPVESEPDKTGLFTAYNRLIERMAKTSANFLRYISHLNHESNTLLASILGYGGLLADPNLGANAADTQEYGRIIVQQTTQLSHLVEDFVLVSRMEGNQFAPMLVSTRLAPLLAAVVDEQCDNAHVRRTIVLNNCPDTTRVVADGLFLEIALRKLIENALVFSPADSQVSVTAQTQPGTRSVLVHIQDQGIGIAPEDWPLLFKPFSRIRNEATRRIPGSGMGLFIASAIVRAHHGEIKLQSTFGKGSTFTIILPVEEA